MALMKEAMSKEDFERQEQGLPPIKRTKVIREEPSPPEVERQITLSDIPEGTILLEYARRRRVRNKEGINFIGYDVKITVEPVQKQKDTKKEPLAKILEDVELEGWMIEGEFLAFFRMHRKEIDQQVIRW
jgi:hypothetical protein